jgi:hypothetical protein
MFGKNRAYEKIRQFQVLTGSIGIKPANAGAATAMFAALKLKHHEKVLQHLFAAGSYPVCHSTGTNQPATGLF